MPASQQRRIDVAPGRFPGWIESFGQQHGAVTARADVDEMTFTAQDGTVAVCQVPFPPLDAADDDTDPVSLAKRVAAHAGADRTVGVLLVRLGGYAAGVLPRTGATAP